jgi:t-SNARE complex subunit (syntaxin)
MTDAQRSQVLQLEERDTDFDRQLDEIGEGIQDLAEIAQLQGEEVKRQAVMLDNVNNKMDKVNERMLNVNAKMKETLDEVGRPSGKLCVDIMCIVLALGFGVVLYNLAVKGTV